MASDVPIRSLPHNSLSYRVLLAPAHLRTRGGAGPSPSKVCWSACKGYAAVVAVVLAWLPALASRSHAADADTTAQLQQVVDQLRGRLGITAPVTVSLVDRDPRVVSVRHGAARGVFELSLQREFAATLDPSQLRAALAHELGHVWIYTHHPYLQTEQLANRVAMRVVTREQLVEVYQLLWGAEALHGSLERFLGVEARAAQ
jgi:hypothetical protein